MTISEDVVRELLVGTMGKNSRVRGMSVPAAGRKFLRSVCDGASDGSPP